MIFHYNHVFYIICLVPKMVNAVVLWLIVYFCVTSVNTKDSILCRSECDHISFYVDQSVSIYHPM